MVSTAPSGCRSPSRLTPTLLMVSFLFRDSDSYSGKPTPSPTSNPWRLTLTHLDIHKNDGVLVFAPNFIRFPVCFLGIVSIGAIVTTVNPLYTSIKLSKQVKDARPKLVITVPELWDKVKGLNLPAVMLKESGGSGIVLTSGSKSQVWDDLIGLGEGRSVFPEVGIRRGDTAALLYSSGTTDFSKDVILTHGNFITASITVSQDAWLAGEIHNVCRVLPMFHVFGLSVILYAQLQMGSSVFSMGRFEHDYLSKSVEEYRITHLWVVPPIILALAKQSPVKKYDLSSLKLIGSGAAPSEGDDGRLLEDFPQCCYFTGIWLDGNWWNHLDGESQVRRPCLSLSCKCLNEVCGRQRR